MFFKKKKERKIIFLGTGPGGEHCPFDKETWAIGKVVMTSKPQWRIDKLFSLDDPDTMLSVTKGVSPKEFLEKLDGTAGAVDKYSKWVRENLPLFENKPKDKEEELKLNKFTHEVSVETEKIHENFMQLTKMREELQYQNKFTREDFIKRVNSVKAPFITQRKHPDIPLSEAFPLKEVIRQFGTPYFTNSICYMIAQALLEEVTYIEIWGVVQGGYQEYLRERKGVEYWLGQAAGRGVKINIRGITQLFVNDNGGRLYGYKKTPQELTQAGIL